MAVTTDITSELAEGQLQLYDFYQPALEAGNYHIALKQTLTIPGEADSKTFAAQQRFVVSAPQFALSPAQIINQYPPAGSTGKYAEVLPHIVLKDPMLAWERTMSGQSRGDKHPIPWLALLVFDEAELLAGDLPATRVSTVSIKAFKAMGSDTLLVPRPEKEDDVDEESACQYIRLSADTFQKVVPRLAELPYLSHVRKVNTGDRPTLGLHEHGLFSVTLANRFPSAPAPGAGPSTAPPTKNIVHLVSLEGLEPHLTEAGVVGTCSEVALLSLASWTFFAQGDSLLDFAGLAKTLLTGRPDGQAALPPEARLLCLPLPPAAAADAAQQEVRDRLRLGYVPLAYHTRSGEDTLAWYRGPLVPQPAGGTPHGPFRSPDAALVYDPAFDVFDVSLAAAWELGRAAALADVAFGPKLLHLRRRAAALLDALHHQPRSTAVQLQLAGPPPATIHEVMKHQLAGTLLADIGALGSAGASPAAGAAADMASTSAAAGAGGVHSELKNMLTDAGEKAAILLKIKEALADDLAPLTTWLSRLLLLWQVPFDNLVPDERLLPAESLRFFHLDDNWFRAAFDGALSLGLDSSKQLHLNDLLRDPVLAAVKQAAGSTQAEGISGLLLRSNLVVGWPNLAVYAKAEVCSEQDIITGPACTLLRIDHLAPDVLLCLFDGVPKQVVLSEPAESLRFGVDDDWNVALRRPTSSSANAGDIGTTTPDYFLYKVGPSAEKASAEQCKTQLLRSPASRVLNLTGLVAAISRRFTDLKLDSTLGPAAFSLQLIKAPESVELPAHPTAAS